MKDEPVFLHHRELASVSWESRRVVDTGCLFPSSLLLHSGCCPAITDNGSQSPSSSYLIRCVCNDRSRILAIFFFCDWITVKHDTCKMKVFGLIFTQTPTVFRSLVVLGTGANNHFHHSSFSRSASRAVYITLRWLYIQYSPSLLKSNNVNRKRRWWFSIKTFSRNLGKSSRSAYSV